MSQISDEAAIRRLVDLFTEGWNAKDGKACARPFAVDADFINIMGLKAHGRDQIARGHDEIFAGIFREMRISSVVESIRFVRVDVAVVDVAFTTKSQVEGPFKLLRSSAGLVATREGNAWSIVAFRNMIPFERPAAGPLERALAANATNPREPLGH